MWLFADLFAGRKQREGENAAPSGSTSRADEAAKPQPRNRAVFEAMRKLQKKRESLPPKLAPTAPRRINLTAHETHAVTPPRTLNPQDLSRLKGERDAAHHAMLRQQAVVRQQAQLAAAQAQLAAQQQAMSQQANSRFMQAQQAAAAAVSASSPIFHFWQSCVCLCSCSVAPGPIPEQPVSGQRWQSSCTSTCPESTSTSVSRDTSSAGLLIVHHMTVPVLQIPLKRASNSRNVCLSLCRSPSTRLRM